MSETTHVEVTKKPKQTRKSLTIAMKKQLVSEYESGMRVVQLSAKYNMSSSTVTTIIKNKEHIKAASVAIGIKKIYGKGCRNTLHDRMENELLIWIHNEQAEGKLITQQQIRNQALMIFNDLAKQSPETFDEVFKGSNGWFHQFKRRTGIWCKNEGLKPVQLKQEKEDVEYEKSMLLHVVDGDPEEVVYHMEPSELTLTDDVKSKEQGEENEDEEPEIEEIMNEYGDNDNDNFDYTDMKIPSEDILRMIHYWEEFHTLAKKWHPNTSFVEELNAMAEEKCLIHYRMLLRKREFSEALGKVISST